MSSPKHPFFDDDFYDGGFGYTVVSSASGFADVGKAYATARRLGTKPDAGAWYVEWTKAADRATAIAENALAGGHRITAARAPARE